jgi:mannose-6-phosphate isomerase-like protein (cupin superfamily)
MNAFTDHLAGKVKRQSLTVFSHPAQVAAATRKRLLLPQGELAQIYNEPEGLRYLAYIELRAGYPRGNHYHERKEEWIYLLHGKLQIVIEDIANRDREVLDCAAGDLVVISPKVAHVLNPLEAGMALEFSPQTFDPSDVIRYILEQVAP